MKLHELLQYLPFARMEGGKENPDILNIEQDSRKVTPGTLFICIEGENFDGHSFAKDAEKNGASAIVAQKPIDVSVPTIYVHDTVRAMAIISSHFYGNPSEQLFVIGVTGTNGKTSVTHMIDHLFKDTGKKTGLIGTLYTKIGNETFETKNTTPDSLTLQKTYRKMKDEPVEVLSMEVSSHALATGRVWGTNFDIAVFTNLSQDHLDFHRTMDEYKHVKGLLFSQLGNQYGTGRQKFAVLNGDDPASEDYKKMTSAHVIEYGLNPSASVVAKNIEYGGKGTTFDLVTPAGERKVHTPLLGLFNVYNLLAAVSVGIIYGLELNEIVSSLESFTGVPGRFELVDEGQPFSVIVDYAHTPDGLENVLQTAQSLSKGKIFAIVGCGGDRDRKKRPLMAQIACQYADYPIFTSDNPRSEDPRAIIKDMEAGVKNAEYKVIVDRKEAIEYAVSKAGEGDMILIAGKGHETYQIIGDQVFDFDDREIAREAIKKRYNT